MSQEQGLPGGNEPWFAHQDPSGPPGVWPSTHSPHPTPPRRPSRAPSHVPTPFLLAPGQAPIRLALLPAQSQHLGVRPAGNQSVSITCRGANQWLFLSCRAPGAGKEEPQPETDLPALPVQGASPSSWGNGEVPAAPPTGNGSP